MTDESTVWRQAHEIATREIDRIRAGKWGGGHQPHPGLAASIATFAISVAAIERGACAGLLETIAKSQVDETKTKIVMACATAIRNRNQ